ncbi:MAG: MBL fold metallo-hydrolase, partial [Rhodospirillaceae bacterium]
SAESKRLNRLGSGAIILAGSGMCDAGRIRHHLKNHLSRPGSTVLMVGYQAPGTVGRLLSEGANMVRIHGEEIAVNARIRMLDEYSGHADQSGLISWIRARAPVRRGIYLIHGEDGARSTLSDILAREGFEAGQIHLPVVGQTERLTAKGPRTLRVRTPVDIPAVAKSDWHNVYARTVLDLRRALDGMRSNRDREKLLRRIERLLKKRKE